MTLRATAPAGPDLIVSDVHITAEPSAPNERFRRFLTEEAPRARRLFILGDLFDYWIGPRHLDLPDHQEWLGRFRDLAGRGVEIHFVPGNRDFTADLRFGAAGGMRVWRHAVRTEFAGRRALLMHGDHLCIRDRGYQTLRRVLRSAPLTAFIRNAPRSVLLRIARGLRRRSMADTAEKVRSMPSAFHLDERMIRAALSRDADWLVCGHVHRPQLRPLTVDGRPCLMAVLGDWDHEGVYAEHVDGELRLRTWE